MTFEKERDQSLQLSRCCIGQSLCTAISILAFLAFQRRNSLSQSRCISLRLPERYIVLEEGFQINCLKEQGIFDVPC